VSVRGKLLLALTPLGVGLALIGTMSVFTISRLGRTPESILRDNYRSVLSADRMKEALERLQSAATLLLAGRAQRQSADVATDSRRFTAELAQEHLGEPDEGEVTARLRAQWADYQAKLDRFMQAQDRTVAENLYFAELEPAFSRVEASTNDLKSLNQAAMMRKSDHAESEAGRINAVMSGGILAALGGGVLLSWSMVSGVTRRLAVLSEDVRRLGSGDFAARASVPGSDEIAGLAASINDLAAHLDNYRRSSLGELLQAQEAAQAAIDSIPDPVIIFGLEGRILNVNQAAEETFGVASADSAADPLRSLDPHLRQVVERIRDDVLAGKGASSPHDFEQAVRVERPENASYFLPRATPVHSAAGTVIGVTMILQDVTRLHRFDELKSDLVATVAHELRTPLTSLRLAIHLCVEQAAGPLTEKQADLLYAARHDCERLRETIDDILDLARAQNGRIELHKRTIDTMELLDDAATALQMLAQERQIEITRASAPLLPDVQADPEQIQHVFSNLLTNAIRHAPEGSEVRLRAFVVGDDVRFEVVDSGVGIAEEHLARVFEKFYRIPGSSSDGARLGLSIAREIVMAHGGGIVFESNLGAGATSWFTLPIANAQSFAEIGA
jgi:two-component system, NtrC family, sensor histidine kinase KinB